MIDPTQAGQPAPAAPGAASAPQGAICIAPAAPGSFMVYPEGGQPQGEPVDLEAALEMVRQALGGQGGQEDAASTEAEAEALFTGEFNKASGRAPQMG